MLNKLKEHKRLVLIVAFVVVFCFSLGIGYSYYMTIGTLSGTASISLPDFAPKVNNSTDMNQSIVLSDTIINGKRLAPGAVGKFKIDLDFSEVDSNVYYNISFDRTNIPNNIKFYVDENLSKEITSIEGVQYITYSNEVAEHYIYWAWIYSDTEASNQDDSLYMNTQVTLPFTASVIQRIENRTVVVNNLERPTGRVSLSGTSGSFDVDLDFTNIAEAKNYSIYLDNENDDLHFYSDSNYDNEITSIEANYDGTNKNVSKTIYWRLDGSSVDDLSVYYIVY